jgi:hypothetical protein
MKLISIANIVLCSAGLALALSLNSCGENVVSSPDSIVFPDSNVSYVYQVAPLMKYTCALGGCHNVFDRAGNIAMDNYFDLSTGLSGALVFPGDPDKSVMMKILDGKLPHSLVVDFRVNANQLKGLRTWIKEGSRNN